MTARQDLPSLDGAAASRPAPPSRCPVVRASDHLPLFKPLPIQPGDQYPTSQSYSYSTICARVAARTAAPGPARYPETIGRLIAYTRHG